MRVLLLLTAIGFASPVAAATPAPPVPVNAPPQTAQDVRKEAPQVVLPTRLNDDRRIQIRPGSTKPNPEGKPGPGIG
jgi:hypothetical protein